MAGHRVYTTSTLRVGAFQLQVRQVLFHGASNVPQQVADILANARNWLRNAISVSTSGAGQPVKEAFELCFRTPLDATKVNTVKGVLCTIRAALEADLGIKIRSEGDAYGYVNLHREDRPHLVMGVVQYDQYAADFKTAAVAAPRGEIHLRASDLSNKVFTTVTLLHEAGHKFANLRDHGMRGYFTNDLTRYREGQLTWQEALVNADSYAVYICKVNEAYENAVKAAPLRHAHA